MKILALDTCLTKELKVHHYFLSAVKCDIAAVS